MKIFAAEDDPIIQDGLKIALVQEGWELVTAASVGEAKSELSEIKDIDICILDIMLPDGTGYDICHEIRKSGETPIIFLTACDDEAHTVLALEQGADDYIAKPFRMRELIARIQAFIMAYDMNKRYYLIILSVTALLCLTVRNFAVICVILTVCIIALISERYICAVNSDRRLRALTDYITAVQDDLSLPEIENTDEGEFGILQSEVYKVVALLREKYSAEKNKSFICRIYRIRSKLRLRQYSL